MLVVLSATVMLVDLFVAIMQVTVSVAIMQAYKRWGNLRKGGGLTRKGGYDPLTHYGLRSM